MSAEQEYLQRNEPDNEGLWCFKQNMDGEDVTNVIVELRLLIAQARDVVLKGGNKQEIYDALKRIDDRCFYFEQECMYDASAV